MRIWGTLIPARVHYGMLLCDLWSACVRAGSVVIVNTLTVRWTSRCN